MGDGLSILRKDFIQVRSPKAIEVAEVVKGAGLKIRSRMSSWVRIPPPAPIRRFQCVSKNEFVAQTIQNRLTPPSTTA